VELRNSVVVVTGGARGIGAAISEAFAAQGAKIAMAARHEDQLAQMAAKLRAQGCTVLPVVTDVTIRSQVDAMIARVENELGPIDILVNNSGTFSCVGQSWEADPETWFHDTMVNVYGTFLVCHAALPAMVKRQGGYVINIAGGGVTGAAPYRTSYACSKAAMARLSDSLAEELRPYGIKVFTVLPPVILTEMTQFILDDPGGKKWQPDFYKFFRKGKDYEQGRDWPPEVVGDLVIQLVSGKADHLVGRCFAAPRDLDEIIAASDRIFKERLLSLEVRGMEIGAPPGYTK
jgi:3-oxoacyl-[acyl-carrier protein] reductase